MLIATDSKEDNMKYYIIDYDEPDVQKEFYTKEEVEKYLNGPDFDGGDPEASVKVVYGKQVMFKSERITLEEH